MIFGGLLPWYLRIETEPSPLTVDGVTFVSSYSITLDPQGYAGYFGRWTGGMTHVDSAKYPNRFIEEPREVITSEILPFDLEGFDLIYRQWGIFAGENIFHAKWVRYDDETNMWSGSYIVDVYVGRDVYESRIFGESVVTERGGIKLNGIGREQKYGAYNSSYQFIFKIDGQEYMIQAKGVSSNVAGAIMEYILAYGVNFEKLVNIE